MKKPLLETSQETSGEAEKFQCDSENKQKWLQKYARQNKRTPCVSQITHPYFAPCLCFPKVYNYLQVIIGFRSKPLHLWKVQMKN